MKPVLLNDRPIGNADDKAGIDWLLASLGFRGSVVTYVEEADRFVLQAVTRDGEMGWWLGSPRVSPASSMLVGDAA